MRLLNQKRCRTSSTQQPRFSSRFCSPPRLAYSDHAELMVAAQEIEDKESIKSRILRIHPGGSTALYAGVELGAKQLQKHLSASRINRVILLSDGLANVGPSSPRELRQLGRALCEKGIAVSTIGVGDDYNEELMAGLAEASDANYTSGALQTQLRQEAENLRRHYNLLQQNQYEPATRKTLQSESWNVRNAKRGIIRRTREHVCYCESQGHP